jgi:hypothetical protein
MDNMIPAGKIAALKTGEMVGMIAQGELNDTDEYKTSAIHGKINLDMKTIKKRNIITLQCRSIIHFWIKKVRTVKRKY